MAETGTNVRPVPKVSEPVIAKTNEDLHEKTFEEQTLEERHQIEDEVLNNYNLPPPTSEEHEIIRQNVTDHLQNKEDNEPLKLKPLFFISGQNEFSVVDMEPFLVAVEYALQGRTILIEGHTDSVGKDKDNVSLSMQRVERVRELMQQMGVPDDRISVIGYGEELSEHDNDTEDGRERNRRVDFTVF